MPNNFWTKYWNCGHSDFTEKRLFVCLIVCLCLFVYKYRTVRIRRFLLWPPLLRPLRSRRPNRPRASRGAVAGGRYWARGRSSSSSGAAVGRVSVKYNKIDKKSHVNSPKPAAYIFWKVSPYLLFCNGTFHSVLAGLGRKSGVLCMLLFSKGP